MINLVSVILPTFNRATYISKAINSVFAQTYRPIELIIVDDCSTDHTKEIINEWKGKCQNDKDFKLRYYRLASNSGACVARNKGLVKSKGRYIQYIDSDDFMEPEKISEQIKLMKKDDSPICLCDFQIVKPNGEIIKRVRNNKPLKKFIRNFISAFTMCPLIDIHQVGKSIKWNPRLQKNQDMEYLIKVYSVCNSFTYIPEFYCSYVHHGDTQISDSYSKGRQYRIIIDSIKEHLKYNFKKLSVNRRLDLILLILRLSYIEAKSQVKSLFK